MLQSRLNHWFTSCVTEQAAQEDNIYYYWQQWFTLFTVIHSPHTCIIFTRDLESWQRRQHHYYYSTEEETEAQGKAYLQALNLGLPFPNLMRVGESANNLEVNDKSWPYTQIYYWIHNVDYGIVQSSFLFYLRDDLIFFLPFFSLFIILKGTPQKCHLPAVLRRAKNLRVGWMPGGSDQ